MKTVIGSPFCAGAIALLMAIHVRAQSKSPEPGPSERWIATWAAAPQPARPLTAIRTANTNASASAQPQANSSPRPSGPTTSLNDQTIRMVIHSR